MDKNTNNNKIKKSKIDLINIFKIIKKTIIISKPTSKEGLQTILGNTIINTINNTIKSTFMHTISANTLKTKGISAIEQHVSQHNPEAIITVRGQEKFVIMPIEQYHHYRELELQLALQETRKAIADGDYLMESVDQHIKRIQE